MTLSRKSYALCAGFVGLLGLAATSCMTVENADETSTDSEVTALSNYKADNISTSGSQITFTGPYLQNGSGSAYRIYQKSPYTLGASKFCADQGFTLQSATTSSPSSARVAIAQSMTADWWYYGNISRPIINSVIVCTRPTAPAPVVTLSANPTTVAALATTTLTWSSTNATSCTASHSAQANTSSTAFTGPQPTAGSTESAPLNQDTTYTLACTGPGGTSSASVTVVIDAGDPCNGCWDY